MYDEPFTGQDPISMGVLVKLIRELNDALGLTSIVVSHDVRETSAIADDAYLLSDGRVVDHGMPDDLWKSGLGMDTPVSAMVNRTDRWHFIILPRGFRDDLLSGGRA